jgi:hypothetical protein
MWFAVDASLSDKCRGHQVAQCVMDHGGAVLDLPNAMKANQLNDLRDYHILFSLRSLRAVRQLESGQFIIELQLCFLIIAELNPASSASNLDCMRY